MAKLRYILAHSENFDVRDAEGNAFLGGSQYWPKADGLWNGAACGPTTAATMLAYLARSGAFADGALGLSNAELATKDGMAALITAVYRFVTPTRRGVVAANFTSNILRFAESKGIALAEKCLVVPRPRRERPSTGDTVRFISDAIASDAPVAFLNYSSGNVRGVDGYHWVTVAAVDGDTGRADLLDNGELKKDVDLPAWVRRSAMGGGFVSLSAA
jgi:hypothetical protein